jgi:hypothetical protein
MEKTNRKSILIFSMAALLAVGAAAVAAGASIKMPSVEATDTTYTFTMDKDHTISGDAIAVGTSGYNVSVSPYKYTAGTTGFGSFTSGGYLVSNTPLYGIKSVTATLASGSMEASFSNQGANWERRTAINPAKFVIGTPSTVAIEGNPNYFYFDFASDTVVTSISITYTCNAIAEPVRETNDLLDFSSDAEKLSKAQTLSWAVSTTRVSTGSTRSHHIFASAVATGWPQILVSLKTPVAITTTGHFRLDGYADTGSKAWVGMVVYDSSWNLLGTTAAASMSTDFSVGSWSTSTMYQTPEAAGTAAFIRFSFNLDDSTSPLSVYLDNLQWVA